MSANVYKFRDPNDHTTYVSRQNLQDLCELRKHALRKAAIQADTEYNLALYRGNGFKHSNYIVLSDGRILDRSCYYKELYTDYDGNNPALVQGGMVGITQKALYKNKINSDYAKYSTQEYVRSRQGNLARLPQSSQPIITKI